MRNGYKKTKYTGVYVKEDPVSKIKTYLVRVKVKGIETEHVAGYSNDAFKTNPSLAFQRRIELINKLKSGHSIKRSDNPTLDEYFHEFMAMRKATLSTNRWKTSNWFYNKYLPKTMRAKKLADLSSADFQKIINQMIEEKRKGSYIIMVKEIFSPMYKKAIEEGIVLANVTDFLKFPKYDNIQYFTLNDEKRKALVNTIMDLPDTKIRLMFMFLLRGRRSNEIRSLCWEDLYLDLEEPYYMVRDSNNKIKKNQRYLFDKELIEHLNYLPKESGLIFKSPRTNQAYSTFPKKPWLRIKSQIGIEMRIHDFRHLLGYTLVNNNVPLEAIQRALGHDKITTTQRYANQKEQMAKTAVDTFLNLVK